MMATMTMTIRNYLIDKGQPLFDIRATFPVNLRPAKQDVLLHSMGNKLALANLTLPVSEPDPTEIVWKIKGQVDTLKNSPQTVIIDAIMSSVIPKMMEKDQGYEFAHMVLDMFGKVTAMLSNVPG